MIFRRDASLLLLAAVSGCATPDPPPSPLAALEADAPPGQPRPPQRLDVADLEIPPIPAGSAFIVVPPAPIPPAEAMAAMARERLSPVGTSGRARFLIRTARFGRHPSAPGGLFRGRTEMLHCTMRCLLEILSPGGALRGSAEAEVIRSATVPASTPVELADSAARLVRLAVADLSLEFERRVRADLHAFLASGAA